MSVRLVSKAFKTIFTRPSQFWGSLRGYVLFRRGRLLSKVFMRPASGVKLGRNVRLQALASLSAEKPNAAIEVGDHSVIYEHARIAAYGDGRIIIGSRAVIGDVRIYSRARVTIGARAVFSWNVFIQDFAPHPIAPGDRARQLESITEHFLPAFDGHKPQSAPLAWAFPTDPVELGDDIWFGANCTILPGVKIGSGSIVAAGAVVTRGDYPAGSILAGNPAKVVKTV